jgi:hypothetical protein
MGVDRQLSFDSIIAGQDVELNPQELDTASAHAGLGIDQLKAPGVGDSGSRHQDLILGFDSGFEALLVKFGAGRIELGIIEFRLVFSLRFQFLGLLDPFLSF